MNSFVESVSPAVKNHVEARAAFTNEAALTLVQSMRQLSEVNLRFSRNWLEQSTAALHQALLAPKQNGEAPPSTEALSATVKDYQRELAQVVSEFQSKLSEVLQLHAPEAARTATELAGAVTQNARQQMSKQVDAGKQAFDESAHFANLAAQNSSMPQAASMQSAEPPKAENENARQGDNGNRN